MRQQSCIGVVDTIRIYKPSRLWVIISGIEVIKPCFVIIEIAAVAERVDLCDVVRAVRSVSVAVGGKHLHRAVAPLVIGISRHDRARSVIDADDIALCIVGKVIGRRRGLRFGRIMVIVKPIYIAAAVGRRQQLAVARIIVVCG